MIKEVVLDADDLHPSIYLIPHLEVLKEHIPNFKITLFTISKKTERGKYKSKRDFEEQYTRFAKMLKEYDWIEVAQHGLDHSDNEFNLTYDETKKRIKEIEKWNKKIGLDVVKVFRAPFWQCSEEAYEALRDAGYQVATDRNQVRPDIKDMDQYRWNWSFETEIPNVKVLKGHGHVSLPSKNNIPECMENLKRLPQDAQYLFVSEYLDKYGSD